MNPSEFIFVVCQVGAEGACKTELGRSHPELKLAFSRPGFLTFKFSDGPPFRNWALTSTFARTWGWSLQRFDGSDGLALVKQIAEIAAPLKFEAIHVWQRDTALPGDHGFEPFETELAREVGRTVATRLNEATGNKLKFNRLAKPNTRVLDLAVVEPNQWWLGWHRVDQIPQRWPGGVPPQIHPAAAISRAYYKMFETLLWGRFPIRKGDVCLDLGSAPGGGTQLLLEHGVRVIAVDPALMDETLATHRGVQHLRMRSREVPRAKLAQARWLFADLNVAPRYTLSAVADLVSNRKTKFYGLGLTLKLTEWELAEQLENYRKQVREWGFSSVKTRQLAFNRQEVCLVALRDKFQTRLGRLPKTREKPAKRRSPPES